MGFVRNRMENTHLTIVRNSPYSLFIKVHFNDTFLPYSISRNLYSFQRKTEKYLEVQEIRCNFASAYSGLLALDGS